MSWILVVMIAGAPTTVPGFQDDWACKSAGNTMVKEIGEKAVFWCFPSKS